MFEFNNFSLEVHVLYMVNVNLNLLGISFLDLNFSFF
jgi:hypothetical protein